MGVLFTNNASAQLASDVSVTDTIISVAGGQGMEFPSASLILNNYFYATLANASNDLEIIRVVERAGNVLTVLRGQEGTTPKAYKAGDLIELRLTAMGLNDILNFAPPLNSNLTSTTIPEALLELDAKKAGLALNNIFTGQNTFNDLTNFTRASFSGDVSFAANVNFTSSSTVTFNGSVIAKNTIMGNISGNAGTATTIAPGSTTIIPVANGGLGTNSLPPNSLVVANTPAFTSIAPGDPGTVLTSINVGGVTVWQPSKTSVIGGSWMNMTSQRADGVTYTNTSGSTIFIVVTGINTSGGYLYINEQLVIGQFYDVNTGAAQVGRTFVCSPVVNNATYRTAGIPLVAWWELR